MPRCILGEGPHVDGDNNRLLWVDIEGKAVHIYFFASQHHTAIPTPTRVGFAVLAGDDSIIAGLDDGIYRYHDGTWNLLDGCNTDARNRFNDGKTSPDGRYLFAGTMNLGTGVDGKREPTGAFYRMDTHGHVTQLRQGVFTSNGIGWSPDQKTMYYIDTGLRKIMQFDYHVVTGTPSHERDFATGKRFDGLCVSDDGHILVAIWGEGTVEIYTPDGRLAHSIALPAPQTTSVALGGRSGNTLYVTSASQLSEAELTAHPLAGQVFVVEGLPYHAQKAHKFKWQA
ncbi:MAG: SMP-30/gluconolactonase/LRE family protein [Alphaproteobacteria bacterium]|nr:SMP-30/gluconolactonase/LRE family protein [Alphaproteobacteria bacterium]MBV8549004.1 SMP-30/gluconolactonase/LRE family protein [Alphaproteobacteria bacterium]